jgi:hypothetical protein
MITISYIMSMSIAAAVLAAGWIEISALLDIPAWIGFAGCTSFFAGGGKLDGAIKSVFGNLSGVMWATVAIALCTAFPIAGMGALTAGAISFMMCWQSQIGVFSVIPTAFIGCFVTYGIAGDYTTAIAGLLCGAIYGVLLEALTDLIYKSTKRLKTIKQQKA